jgi:hypothetical protein
MAASDLYPFASPDGQSIPLEIVEGLSMVAYTFAVNTSGAITIPANFDTCWVFATEDCVIQNQSGSALPNTLVSGTEYGSATFIPARTPISIKLTAGAAHLLGLATAGKLYVHRIRQWAAMKHSQQTTVG